jgi:nucleoside-diphosphate-sugar epimerase
MTSGPVRDCAAMSRLFLVTGGAGFIGSAIVRALVERGDRVRVIDNLSTGTADNLAQVETQVELVKGDILDDQLLSRSMKDVEVVFHQAAVSSVPRSVAEPLFVHDVNATGTVRVLNAARHAGVRRVVYAASASAYGNGPVLPKVETLAPEPISPYAVSKLSGEHYCRSFREVYGFETVSLRYFNVFGPGQAVASEYAAVIPRFVTAALERSQVVVFGDGEQSRDFCFIDDVVVANLAAADASEAPGRTFNIASGKASSLNDVLKVLGDILGRDVARRHEASRDGDVRHSWADIGLARKHLSYSPMVSFRDGLAKTVEWYKAGGGRSIKIGGAPRT